MAHVVLTFYVGSIHIAGQSQSPFGIFARISDARGSQRCEPRAPCTGLLTVPLVALVTALNER